MTPGDDEPIGRARDAMAARITAEHPGWQAGHDAYGWHAQRFGDGHTVRATGPDGLRAMIGCAPPLTTWQVLAETRRAYPGWHIWEAPAGWWHARRRGNFREDYRPGAPIYAVHEDSLVLLRARLEQQEELDRVEGVGRAEGLGRG